MISASLSVIAATLWLAAVEVRSTTDCPSAQAVTERLIPLLPPSTGPGDARDVAQIQVVEIRGDGTADLWLRLLRADASEIGDRRVSLQGSCSEMAEAVATIFATWKTDPRPEGFAAPKDTAILEEETPPAALGSSPPAYFEYLLGAGVGVAMVGGTAAAGNLEVLAGRPTSHWQLRLSVAGQTSRQVALAPGSVDWQHSSAALGLAWRLLNPRWLVGLDAGPLAGWATVSGQGFASSRQKRSFEYGGTTGVRLGRKIGRWAFWAEARVALWIQGYRAQLIGSSAARDLPIFDATASLGASVSLFP
ncbi:MAG TPA: hypothetical protein VF518_02220 [Polyangia bacterium]